MTLTPKPATTPKETTKAKRICALCGSDSPDMRHLAIDCFWNMGEISPLFKQGEDRLWRMDICKGCRAILLEHIARWIAGKGRLIDPHVDDDGIAGYTLQEVRQGLAGPELQKGVRLD